jgi:Cytochrome c554 and c-prime
MITALSRTRSRRGATLAALLLGAASAIGTAAPAATPAAAPTAPSVQVPSSTANASTAAYKHLGVTSCSSSVCHGKIAAQTDRHVQLNEYRIWQDKDRHAQAYRALERPLGKEIASKLGLPSASTAKVCLDCHADNVPEAMRGPKFNLRDDAVSCEACHGGSERWIKSHSDKNATHAKNLDLGMYATEAPTRRAQLCQSCHLGSEAKFATHRLMAAGHPRLQFELDGFSANQSNPSHYTIDADYIQRKGKIDDINLWLAGQIEYERRYLSLLQSPLFAHAGLFAEFALYDCFGCHHPLEKDKLHWKPARAETGVPPGTIRLQRQSLLMLQAMAEAIGDGTGVSELVESGNALTRAGQTDAAAVRDDARKLSAWLNAREPWTRRTFSRAEISAVRKTLLRYAATERASDYLAAEQIVTGVDSLSVALGDRDARKSEIDRLYDALNTSSKFEPTQFAATAGAIAGRF